MELNKKNWNKTDIKDFENYLKSFSNTKEKILFEKRIVNTNLPCLGINSSKIKELVNEIKKGNFIEFLNYMPFNNHTETIINGKLICSIKNFNVMKKYLTIYANKIDNWASADTLKFNINETNKENFYKLSLNFIDNKKTFVKRIGFLILFNFINKKDIYKIFNIIDNFKFNDDYYVNMVIAWLLCECFVKEKELTFIYLKNSDLPKFVINKCISKCHDSYRISQENKNQLKYLRK